MNNTVEMIGGENLEKIKKFYLGHVKLEVAERPYIGLAKSSFGFSVRCYVTSYRKTTYRNPNKLFGQSYTKLLSK